VTRRSPYGRPFYEEIGTGSEASAERLLPVVLELVSPRSAVDLGCGDGSWLAVLRRLGVADVLGVDGPWALSDLKIPRRSFAPCDLAQPVEIGRRFDLAISLEVGEHLPAASGRRLVEQLTDIAPAVLFSAAVPGQGGTGHVNEQWPDYWAALFERRGFAMVDVLRARFWDDPTVEPWYLQNIFLFVSEEARAGSPKLTAAVEAGPQIPVRVVHPRMFALHDGRSLPLGTHLRHLPGALATSLRHRKGRVWPR
jgi:SAM-dependent methyltransferase